MSKYRKKAIVVEAFRLGFDYIPDWFMDAVSANKVILRGTSSGFDHVDDTSADIHTLEGWHHANYGDYIIRGVKGEIYPCKADIFAMTYETADKPQTNSDRIRAMSDEGLAKHLLHIGWDCHLCVEHERLDNNPWLHGEKCDENCAVHCLEWLQQPAEEGK